MDVKILLPVRGFVKPYLKKMTGEEELTISKKNGYSLYFFNMLTRATTCPIAAKEVREDYPAQLTVSIPIAQFPKGIFLSAEMAEEFSKFIYESIRDRMFFALDVSGAVEEPGRIKSTIERFLLEYDLIEWLNYEALKKAYYRYRKRMGQGA